MLMSATSDSDLSPINAAMSWGSVWVGGGGAVGNDKYRPAIHGSVGCVDIKRVWSRRRLAAMWSLEAPGVRCWRDAFTRGRRATADTLTPLSLFLSFCLRVLYISHSTALSYCVNSYPCVGSFAAPGVDTR